MARILQFQAAYLNEAWISPCYVSLDDAGCILAIGSEQPAGMIAEQSDGYLLPGFSNGHSHSFQFLMAGMAEKMSTDHQSDDFWTWRERMYKLADAINPEQLLELTTRFYQVLLQYGYTAVCEFHYLHHDKSGKHYAQPAAMSEAIMEAARRAGIRLTLVPVYYNQSAPGIPIQSRQKRFFSKDTDEYLELLEQVAQLNRSHYPETIVGYGVHSMRAASPRDIKTILGTHWALGPAHIHVSEQSTDAIMFEQAYHSRAIDWLYDNLPLADHHNLIHATHINSVEIKKLAASKATVVLCPSTEANLGDGIFPLLEYFQDGGRFCIGTDSHISLCPFSEARLPEYIQRLFLEKRNVLCDTNRIDSGKILFDQISNSGRRALGLAKDPFAVGHEFDGIVLDSEDERLIERPLSSILGIAMYAGDARLIDSVYVRGKKLVSKGKHVDQATTMISFKNLVRSIMNEINA